MAKPARSASLVRVLRLLALLQQEPRRYHLIGRMAALFRVCPRTVYRDLTVLRSVGYDTRSTYGPGGVCWLPREAR